MESIAEILKQLGLHTTATGVWIHSGITKREQGWKLHVSSIPVAANDVLQRVVPILHRVDVPFKVARDLVTLGQLNEGALGATQVGKFMTIYPTSDEVAIDLAREIAKVTSGLRGPVVLTDYRIGDVLYARYGTFAPAVFRDRLGNVSPAIREPNGSLRPDSYSVPFAAPPWILNPFAEAGLHYISRQIPAAPAPGLFGPGYLLFAILRQHPRGNVYFALDARSQESVSTVVLKEGRAFCLSDEFDRDIRDRLRRQLRIHTALHSCDITPNAREYFEVQGNGYLALEFIEGRDLSTWLGSPALRKAKRERELLWTALDDLITRVSKLHAAGYVHRDITPTNVRVTSSGRTYLLDVEIAHHRDDPSPPFTEGTPGFASPQQVKREPPRVEDDIFSLGRTIGALLTGVEPTRLAHAGATSTVVQFRALAGTPDAVSEVVIRAAAPDPGERPTLEEIGQAVQMLRTTHARFPRVGRRTRDKTTAARVPTIDAAEIARDGVVGLLSRCVLDPNQGLWLSATSRQASLGNDATPQRYELLRSAHRGVSGVLYVLARAARAGCWMPEGSVVEPSVDWLLAHHHTNDDQLAGLYFGEAGVAVSLAECSISGLIAPGDWLDDYLDEALQGPLDWYDITHGAAGMGVAAMACGNLLGKEKLATHADRCAEFLIETQNANGGWPFPEGIPGAVGLEYTGFAHGTAGILYFLTEYWRHATDDRVWRAIERGIDRLRTSVQVSRRKVMTWPTMPGGDDFWRWWCHGGPGIALTYLALFEATGDPDHAEFARAALRVHDEQVRWPNLTTCHGLAGLGEIYLEAYRCLGESRWLDRAFRVAHTLRALARFDSGTATWLVEDSTQPTADLMVGCAGVVHFFIRLRAPMNEMGFPLLLSRRPKAKPNAGHDVASFLKLD